MGRTIKRILWGGFMAVSFVTAHAAPALVGQDTSLPPLHIERVLSIQKGKSLAQTLTQAGFSNKATHALIRPLNKKVSMRKFYPGQKITITYTEKEPFIIGEIKSLSFFTKRDRQAFVSKKGSIYRAEVKKRLLNRQKNIAIGEIKGSLYLSAEKANLPAALVPAFANLFAWELDFTRDIHPGDTFKVVYEDVRDENGKYLRAGPILAAELHARGKLRSAYRVKDKRGVVEYYDAKGAPKKKLLLRTPLEFTRISSHFNPKRKHPVLGYTRAHRGTDFAAPTGTPIKASGSGVIEMSKWHGAYGRYIKIKHNHKYTTGYAHLSRFARGIKKGKRVRQGQVIGYVGTSGRSTGPHLHYEVMVHNKKVNAMRAKLPAGNPLPRSKRTWFNELVAAYKNTWQQAADTRLAQK